MRSPVLALAVAVAVGITLITAGCGSKYPEISKKECGKIVANAQKLLGKQADPAKKLMADCKKAEPTARGCAKLADSAADLLRCSM